MYSVQLVACVPCESCAWSAAPAPAPEPEPPGASDALGALGALCARGLRNSLSEGCMASSYSVKLKSGGSARPLGSRAAGSRSSSKKLCAHACSGDSRAPGVYSSSRDTSEIASGGVHARNTCTTTHITFITLYL